MANPLANALELREGATGFDRPVFATAAGSSGAMFVAEQSGVIRWFDAAAGTQGTLLDIRNRVESNSGERGLLGLALDPEFATNRHFYVNYIDRNSFHTIVERYTADASGLQASAASARRVMQIDQPPQYSNHKAGWMGFRPNEPGHLYIATGDGGGGGDPLGSGQNLNTLLGKVLRVDVRGDDFAGDDSRNYAIPTGNPFAGATPGRDEIWAYGLRNPYRNSFDRQTGDLWIADVGQGAREEVNFEPANSPGGTNYGWDLREGTIPTPGVGTGPVYEYVNNGGDASVIGGYVYRGPLQGLQGTYFFADFVRGTIGSFRYGAGGVTDLIDRTGELATPSGLGAFSIVSFGEGASGDLYVVDYGGRVLMLVPEPGAWVLMGAGLVLLLAWSAGKRPRLQRAVKSGAPGGVYGKRSCGTPRVRLDEHRGAACHIPVAQPRLFAGAPGNQPVLAEHPLQAPARVEVPR